MTTTAQPTTVRVVTTPIIHAALRLDEALNALTESMHADPATDGLYTDALQEQLDNLMLGLCRVICPAPAAIAEDVYNDTWASEEPLSSRMCPQDDGTTLISAFGSCADDDYEAGSEEPA